MPGSLSHLTDRDLLAWLLYGEASGEGALGQLAVAWAVFNRMAHPYRWASDLPAVILQPGQFSGLARLPPAVRDPRFSGPPPLDCGAVATLSLHGVTSDPTGGATHFHAVWLRRPWNLPEVWRHGGHIFYRED